MTNDESCRDIVLITGGSGFLGQHVVKRLQCDESVREIRIVDIVPYKNTLDKVDIVKPIVCFVADLCEKETCREAVRDVDVVFHCAALVSYEFPPDKEALRRNNVLGTENLLELCIEENVRSFVNCGTTEVALQPYVRGGIVALVVHSQESKTRPPENENKLIFGDYAITKLKAERLALKANGTRLSNGHIFRTVSLRLPMMYGEGDVKFIPGLLRLAKKFKNSLVQFAGVGGKHQLLYAGNAAWAFICAKDTLSRAPENIGGFPIIVTDDTVVEDLLRFCERITRNSEDPIRLSWSIPTPLSYFVALLTELVINYVFPIVGVTKKLSISPTSLIAYMGSLILYNRNRAAIQMNYSPIYKNSATLELASDYYSNILRKSKTMGFEGGEINDPKL